MEERRGWLSALRWVLLAALIINAVTLIVYFRVQEYRLKYRISRLEERITREREATRELSRELLKVADPERLQNASGLRGAAE